MNESDIELSARFAAYERIIEFLLTDKLARTNPDKWAGIKAAIIGPNVVVTKGMIDVSDLEHVEKLIHDRIDDIFGRSSDWANRALK